MHDLTATRFTSTPSLDPSGAAALGKAAKSSQDDGKIDKAAHDFEAILLGSWLQSAEKTFAKVPGTDDEEQEDSGGAQFLQMAMQSLGTSLAAGGGIGIAKLIAKGLHTNADSHQDQAPVPSTAEPVLPKNSQGQTEH